MQRRLWEAVSIDVENRLSILYLRCTGWVVVIGNVFALAFNSLFEMPRHATLGVHTSKLLVFQFSI